MSARSILLIAAFAAAPLVAQAPQDALEPDQPITAAPPGTLGAAQAAAARGDQPEALSQYLHVLSSQPNNVAALAGAGRAALAVGDLNAATGFFARAEDLAPNDGSVKAGLASATVQTGNARAALRYFRQALALGVPEATIASDRGLAYDLAGDNRRAQAEYRIALAANPGNAVAMRRLALSQAISGDQSGAMVTLDPLLRRQDVPAWRTRAFVKALAGDVTGAESDAALVLPPNQVATIRPYLVRLAALKSSDKAAAVFLGRFPTPGAGRGTTVARTTAPTLPRVLTAPPTTRAITPAPAPVVTAERSYSLPAKAGTPAAALAPLAEAASSTASAQAQLAPAEPDVEDSPAMRAHMRAVAAAKAKSDAAAKRAEALAQQKKKQAAEEEKARKANPARHWVQVAGGANKADLPRAWTQLKSKWSTQLSGRSPWTMHYRYTNRLLIGPFKTSDEAQDWVSARKKEGFATFRVETNAGDVVEKL